MKSCFIENQISDEIKAPEIFYVSVLYWTDTRWLRSLKATPLYHSEIITGKKIKLRKKWWHGPGREKERNAIFCEVLSSSYVCVS